MDILVRRLPCLGYKQAKSVFSIMFCILNKPESASPGLSAALSLSAAPFLMRLLRSERSRIFVEPEKRFPCRSR